MSLTVEPVSESPSHRPSEHRDRLQELRDQARERYAGGAPALQVATLICERVERLVVEIFGNALKQLPEPLRGQVDKHLAIVAIGGTGRGELAPYSDVDILFLRLPGGPGQLIECIAQTVRDCWDAGIHLGHSVRTPSEALAAAKDDPQFATALVEARAIWGDERVVEHLRSRFYRRSVRSRYARFFRECVAAREAERAQHGATERQLEPDVKRSAGGLRDIHLIRWIGFAAFGTSDIDLLRRQDALTKQDADALLAAHEFITRIRVDLHYAAGRSQEILTREEQLRLSDLFGITGVAGQRPVERFMQLYFRHATAVTDIAARFVARHRPRPLLERIRHFLLSHRSNHIFRVSGREIDVPQRHRARVCESLEELLRLYELAALYSARPSPELCETIRMAVPRLSGEVTPATAQSFMTVLGSTGNVGPLLRSLYATGLLELVLPEMSHARCLQQFNQYHSYTVDEHSLRAVEAVESFDADSGSIGSAYRKIRHKELLHLALLLHDLGKGFDRDHSEVGRELAFNVAARLGLSDTETETVVFLVHKHLMMGHLAFRRDLSDLALLARFSREVGSPERLRMLYVLTAADITAVGPSAWTSWKAELLTELFERSLQILSGGPPQFREAARNRQILEQVRSALVSRNGDAGSAPALDLASSGGLEERFRSFPSHYLAATSPPQIIEDLRDVEKILAGDARCLVHGSYDAASETVEYRIVTRDEIGSGLFSKMAGVLTAKGMQILSATICTTTDGAVIDRFRVVDGDHSGVVPDFRLHEVSESIETVLAGQGSVEDLFVKHRRFLSRGDARPLFHEAPRVVIDNDSSERCTVIDVFADDRRGLLYAIAAALFELDLSVSLAKIATHADQVLDVFYVTDRDGAKVQAEPRLREIQATLAARIDQFERQG